MAFEIPATLAQVDAEWLTRTLREERVTERAAVLDVRAERLGAGVGLIGCVARLTLRYDSAEPDAPRTLIAKLPTDNPKNRKIGDGGDYEREVRFYQELAPELGVRVPRCYAARIDEDPEARAQRRLSRRPGLRFVLLLEDMAPARVGDDLAGCGTETAAAVLRTAARLHASLWESPRLADLWWAWPLLGKTDAPSDGMERFDRKARAAFREETAGRVPDRVFSLLERISSPGALEALARPAPRTFVHTDFRLDNLCFSDWSSDAEVTLLDWQAAGVGTGAWDVASFLSNSLSADVGRRGEDDLLGLYHETLCEVGVRDYPFRRFERDYALALLMILRTTARHTLLVDWEGASAERRERSLQRKVARLRRVDPDEVLGAPSES